MWRSPCSNVWKPSPPSCGIKLQSKKKKPKKAAKKKEFMGIFCVDSANQKLDDAMEVKGDEQTTLRSLINKEVDKKVAKSKSKEKKEKRKNSSGSGKSQPQGPTRTGRNGKKDATDAGNKSSSQPKKNLKKPSREERGRSPKRKPPRDFSSHHDDDSYDNRSYNRSSSRRKYEGKDNRRPRSILKKRVRFQSEKKGRGGRGQGGREGRGGAPSGSRRGLGGRT